MLLLIFLTLQNVDEVKVEELKAVKEKLEILKTQKRTSPSFSKLVYYALPYAKRY